MFGASRTMDYASIFSSIEDYNINDLLQEIEQVEDDEDDYIEEVEHIDLTSNGRNDIGSRAAERPNHHSLPRIQIGALQQIGIYDFVELVHPIGEYQIKFLEIRDIWLDETTSDYILRGVPYTRTRNTGGQFECKRNEVCKLLEVICDNNANVDEDLRRDEEQAMRMIRPDDILAIRTLYKTNIHFPHCRYGRDFSWSTKTAVEREERGPLTCRWIMKVEYQSARHKEDRRACGGALIHLSEEDVEDATYRVPDQLHRENWRGDAQHREGSTRTMADIFCGAGGTSCGAKMAGFKPVIAVDNWSPACQTYRRNFRNARVFEQDVTTFINECPHRYCVDVLHMSPPCQPYSPAHTRPGSNDEINIAALFSSDVLDKTRPRLTTLEQTFGIAHDRHTVFLHALIQGFTCRNFSLRWRIVHLVEYGLPQTRRRLIMLGACPGEKLPPFPPPTHGPATGRRGRMKAFVTEAEAIDRIPRNATLHDVRTAFRVDKPPRNPNTPLKCTVTCGGTDKTFHYSGKRAYTLRELACLQGFPTSHLFLGGNQTAIKRQIGNAFPPSVVKVIYEHLHAWLDERDRIYQQAAGGGEVGRRSSPAVREHSLEEILFRDVSSRQEEPRNEANEDPIILDTYNGGLNEEEAVEAAVKMSRESQNHNTGEGSSFSSSFSSRLRNIQKSRRKAPAIITLSDDSDQEDTDEERNAEIPTPRPVREATDEFQHLSVAPVGEDDNGDDEASVVEPPSRVPPFASWPEHSPEPPRSSFTFKIWRSIESDSHSRESSATLDFSPSPSPDSRPGSSIKRKLSGQSIANDGRNSAQRQSDSPFLNKKRIRRRGLQATVEDYNDDDPNDVNQNSTQNKVTIETTSQPRFGGRVSTSSWASESASQSQLQSQSREPSAQQSDMTESHADDGNVHVLDFGRKLWKLPATPRKRDDWRF